MSSAYGVVDVHAHRRADLGGLGGGSADGYARFGRARGESQAGQRIVRLSEGVESSWMVVSGMRRLSGQRLEREAARKDAQTSSGGRFCVGAHLDVVDERQEDDESDVYLHHD
jgi:hypothetical protein